jgi:hypothetical protein
MLSVIGTKLFLLTLAYTFTWIGVVVDLSVEDCFQAGKRSLIRFKEKGGKEKGIPVYHNMRRPRRLAEGVNLSQQRR